MENMTGKGEMVFANGETYSGDWKENLRCGIGTFTWPDGERYEGVANIIPDCKFNERCRRALQVSFSTTNSMAAVWCTMPTAIHSRGRFFTMRYTDRVFTHTLMGAKKCGTTNTMWSSQRGRLTKAILCSMLPSRLKSTLTHRLQPRPRQLSSCPHCQRS